MSLIKINKKRFTYKTGPNAGKVLLTRTVVGLDNKQVDVVKTNGTNTFGVSWCSTEIVSGISLDDALKVASEIVLDSQKQHISNMRQIAHDYVSKL